MADRCREAAAWANRKSTPSAGLPDWAYTDPEVWDRECATVLAENWTFAGFAHVMPNPGDVRPVTIAGKPILLVRNRRGEIAGFHNVCRHRCLMLVEAPKNVGKLIRCPYHAWTYDLGGALKGSPHFGGMNKPRPAGFDPAANGLVPVRLHLWHDWIFVNLSGTAPDFDDYAAALKARLSGIDLARTTPVAVLDFGEIAANWKFIMENFIEPYHVQFVHSATTRQPLSHHRTIVDGVCLGSAVDLDDEQDTTSRLAVSSIYLALFPTFIVGRYYPDQLGVYLNIPLGPGRTAQSRAIYTTDGWPRSPEAIEGLKTLWWNVHTEDHMICERMQLGRASPVAAAGGLLSPHWEDSVRVFQERVAHSISSKGD